MFEQPGVQCFWMKTPLAPHGSVCADDGTIVNLADMKPLTEDSHCSAKPVRYVLEMNQGLVCAARHEGGQQAGRGYFFYQK